MNKRKNRPHYVSPRIVDRRRWRREARELMKRTPHAEPIAKSMWDGDDDARLILADLAEENGLPYLAMFLRKHLICKQKEPE